MTNPNQRPFNLIDAKAGAPVSIQKGSKARITCFDKVSTSGYSLMGLIDNGQGEVMHCWHESGLSTLNAVSSFDLAMIPHMFVDGKPVFTGDQICRRWESSLGSAFPVTANWVKGDDGSQWAWPISSVKVFDKELTPESKLWCKLGNHSPWVEVTLTDTITGNPTQTHFDKLLFAVTHFSKEGQAVGLGNYRLENPISKPVFFKGQEIKDGVTIYGRYNKIILGEDTSLWFMLSTPDQYPGLESQYFWTKPILKQNWQGQVKARPDSASPQKQIIHSMGFATKVDCEHWHKSVLSAETQHRFIKAVLINEWYEESNQ